MSHIETTPTAQNLLNDLGLASDDQSIALVSEVLAAIAAGRVSAPAIGYESAAAIGSALASRWSDLTGTSLPTTDELIWADLVQFVLHRARNIQWSQINPKVSA